MKWVYALGITIVFVLITLYEWPKMNREQKKIKAAFIVLTGAGWLLSTLFIFIPDLPGPTDVLEWIFKPLDQMLET